METPANIYIDQMNKEKEKQFLKAKKEQEKKFLKDFRHHLIKATPELLQADKKTQWYIWISGSKYKGNVVNINDFFLWAENKQGPLAIGLVSGKPVEVNENEPIYYYVDLRLFSFFEFDTFQGLY